jgi:hypothetical protein
MGTSVASLAPLQHCGNLPDFAAVSGASVGLRFDHVVCDNVLVSVFSAEHFRHRNTREMCVFLVQTGFAVDLAWPIEKAVSDFRWNNSVNSQNFVSVEGSLILT